MDAKTDDVFSLHWEKSDYVEKSGSFGDYMNTCSHFSHNSKQIIYFWIQRASILILYPVLKLTDVTMMQT